MQKVYGEGAVSYSWCRKWFQRFRAGNRDLEDRLRAGRPSELDPEAVQAVLDQNPSLSTRDMAETLGVSHQTV